MLFKLQNTLFLVDSLKTKKGSKNWAIIGAGVGGLASAIRLASLGLEVDLYESNAYPGGKLSDFQLEGFRFDAGPSLWTMPQYLEELFSLVGKDLKDYLLYEKLEESCRYFYEDGTLIHGYSDPVLFSQEIEKNTQDKAESLLSFLKYSQKIYEITHSVFLEKSLHQFNTYFTPSILPSIWGLPQIDMGRNMNKALKDFFIDPKTIQLFNRYATYNGSNPYRAPATLHIIPHLENYFGAYFPKEGMIGITKALEKLALELGVQIHYNTPVQEILLENNKVMGIRVGGCIRPYSGLISNMDVYPTYRKLLTGKKAPDKTLNRERSSSALIFYWGIQGEFSELDLHNIFFSKNYSEEFECLEKGGISEDPTIYIQISAKKRKLDAPNGKENWFTMINVPSNKGQDWDELIKTARHNILRKLNRQLGRDITHLIQVEKILDPREIEWRTSSHEGALYGTNSNQVFSAFFRHPNFSSRYKGLYFVGGSVHPGGGIPLALLSAKITAEIIDKHVHKD